MNLSANCFSTKRGTNPINQMEKEFLALVGQRWPAGTDTPVRKSNP